jgi:DeoR/GlpR family transcriptional regulator of sugar metabolism
MSLRESRHSYILQEIESCGSVSVVELAKNLNVSKMTIRRDLIELEKEGLIRRVHGGAVSAHGRSYEPPFLLRSTEASEAKQKIGACAAKMVVEGDSIALDVGTTTLEVAKNLIERRNLTIITPSLRIANLLFNQPGIRLILPGGIVRPGEASLVGDLTRLAFQELFVDRLFLGIGCIDSEVGLTEYNWDDALVKRAMIKSAKEVILVADSSKFDKVAFVHVASFNQIHKLVTDAPPPEHLARRLIEAKVKVVVAGDED